MSGNRKRSNARRRSTPQAKRWPVKMKLFEAAKFLGISSSNLSNLVSSGKISVEDDPLDRRVKLVKRTDLEEILHRRTGV